MSLKIVVRFFQYLSLLRYKDKEKLGKNPSPRWDLNHGVRLPQKISNSERVMLEESGYDKRI